MRRSFALASPIRIHSLLHDGSEAWTTDVVSSYKREDFRQEERDLTCAMYKNLGLLLPTTEEHAKIKAADKRALLGEIWTGAGEDRLKAEYPDRDAEAEELTLRAITDWPADRLVTTDTAGYEFERLFEEYRK